MSGVYRDIYSDIYEAAFGTIGLASSSTDAPANATRTSSPAGSDSAHHGRTTSSTSSPRVISETSSN